MQMDISWDAQRLVGHAQSFESIPTDLHKSLSSGSNAEYLDAITKLALDSRFTSTVFTTHEPIFVEICSRWLNRGGEDRLLALSALSRVLSIRPYLHVFVTPLLSDPGSTVLEALGSRKANALQDISQETLNELLLTLYRLLTHDNARFAEYIAPAQMQSLLAHNDSHIRYMAIKILALYLHASDAALVDMVKRYVGEEAVHGHWEGKVIDYTFLTLWEQRRVEEIAEQLEESRKARNEATEQLQKNAPLRRIMGSQEFSRTTACLGGVLVPRLSFRGSDHSSFVMTDGSCKNLAMFAEGLNSGKPLIVTGLEGSGKTSMVRHAARTLGVDGNMVTLHLNEQTDAKLLVGMYVSDKDTDHFTWKPGVLTKAVLDGRWLMIEDLDRAPTEILSLLLPLLERRELFVPNWGESIVANPNFKLIATVRTSEKSGGEELDPSSHLLGRCHWSSVPTGRRTTTELFAIIEKRSPLLHFHIPQIKAVYSAVRSRFADSIFGLRTAKSPGPREVLRWSGRIGNLLLNNGVRTGSEPISDATKDDIFLEAIDCFAAAIPQSSRDPVIEVIAAELHMPQERVRYCLHTRVPRVHHSESVFSVGRVKIPKSRSISRDGTTTNSAGRHPFAVSKYVSRILESVGATVERAEPCLLVGETGTGKTTVLQNLAQALNKRLVVINLSQQSESGDLLGSLQPINVRSLAMPLSDEFNELLLLTFASKTNQQVVASLNENIAKAKWSRVLHIWRKTVGSVQRHIETVLADAEQSKIEPQTKKRKLRKDSYQQLQPRWDQFASNLETFRVHASSGPKGFAFSFVESSVVKAAREGDWVLLDEINLASPDTLESLADLLYCEYDGRPSLLLSETGNTERIYAHNDFRIFGAMNPATDIGKRDLPPSIRSRFSEFYVDGPDSDLKNLTPLVAAYLGNNTHSDVRLATDTAELYLKIKDLARSNILADGSDRKAHVSLRNLSRALNYAVDLASSYGLRRALYEGFCMTFTTGLNQGSERLLRPLIQDLAFGSSTNQNIMLQQTPRIPQDGKRYVHFRHYWIAQGNEPIERNPRYIITPFIERNLLNLVRATSTRKYPVLLQGPTSSGKTSMVEYLAKISGNKFVRINNHEHTDLQEYLGSYLSGSDGSIRYQEGLLVQALKEGSWVVLDELNLAPTDVLEALNRLLDDNRELFLPETQQVVRPHENFMLFATQNPPGLYGGRKALSRAFQNRFLELHFDDIPEDELETILRERSQIAPSFCKKIVTVYQRLSILRQTTRLFEQRNSFATLRDLFRWALRDADDREQLAINGFLLLAERVRDEKERQSVKRVIEEVMKVDIDEDQLYSRTHLEQSLGSPLPSPQGLTWTKPMRRLYVLVTQALRNHEPVLLVGHTGLGKTTICQAIAEIMETKIHIVNAHQNMETGDLIGAQRPLRDKSSAQDELLRDYVSALTSSDVQARIEHHDLEELSQQYETLIQQRPESISTELRLKIQRSRSRVNTLFEWSDGSLVQAMRAGHHYLLDEISLADDSVLERLNSVLEPGRSLLLAEKGTYDAQVRAAGHFQFLATMNPGGDYGKRELSPALRNRFTEIWVPKISEEDEMLEIVLAKLPLSRAAMARPMIDFAVWYSSQSDHDTLSSLRDLLSWANFVNIFHEAETAFLAFHGAALVYLDGISVNWMIQTTAVDAVGVRGFHASLQKLNELFSCDVKSYINTSPPLQWDANHIRVGEFKLSRNPSRVSDLQYSLQAPTTRLNAMKIVRALQLQKPILLEGSPGVGKTTLISTLAQAVGIPLTRINLSDQTDLMDLFGCDVPLEGQSFGHFGWRDAPFLRAMQSGEWVLLDEMNLASQTVLEGLNACLDHRGQVYISELNRTFRRHPNFVVFAAQNPQSQGGGRKGLPASFVNRFTTVFAASFNTEDLQLICNDLFPEVSADTINRLIRCLSVLNTHLDENPRLATNGGPWSMNLRDILRWLQLLTFQGGLISSARPVDFVNLLIVQRFRNSADRASISKIIDEILPYVGDAQDLYHAISPHALQVGSVILPRDDCYQPLSTSTGMPRGASLQIMESIMVCTQMNWPCLLVGPTGSGKSTVIRQVASFVGAELLTIEMNPDMDTSDLVGGLAQSNTNRDINAFVTRAEVVTEKAIIRSVIAGNKADIESFLELKSRLANTSTDITQLLQAAAQSSLFTEYQELFQEYQSLMKRNDTSNRARFEWVDGSLVQALKHGKWLIMNNGNLCEPSVLDRINSLLEPDGELSINEHRNPDGSAQIVKPHPNFRLFITMDPRHGELSKAMRNRSVEIFMPAQSLPPAAEVDGLDVGAILARFQIFQIFDWDKYDDIEFVHMMSICLQNLSMPDIVLCNRWQSQILLGLTSLPPSRYQSFQAVISVYHDMFFSRHTVIEKAKACYSGIIDSLDHRKGFSEMQSIHPFNNSILLSELSPISRQLQCLGHWFDLIAEFGLFKQKLMYSTRAMTVRRIELGRSIESDQTQNTARCLDEMSSCLSTALDGYGSVDVANKDFLRFANEILAYLKDLLDTSTMVGFDEGILQTYQSIGRSLVADRISSGQSDNPLQMLADQLASKFFVFNTEIDCWSGLAMEQLWSRFKPRAAASQPQFEMCMEIEGLADRFDALKWGSGASVFDLVMLRDALIAVNESVDRHNSETVVILEKAKQSLRKIKNQTSMLSGNTAPYFHAQFKTLTQLQFLNDGCAIGRQNVLELLADRPTKASIALEKAGRGWQTISQVYLLAPGSQQGDDLAVFNQSFLISTIHKLCKFDEVALSGLRLLTEELNVLSTCITQMCSTIEDGVMGHMSQRLNGLRTSVVHAFQTHNDAGVTQSLPNVDSLCKRLNEVSASNKATKDTTLAALLKCSTAILRSEPSVPVTSDSKTALQLANDWIQVYAGLLLLYVPGRLFDPALRPYVELSRYRARVAELQNKLNAMEEFQVSFTGSKSSYRIRLLQEELKSMGNEPPLLKIYRPAVSKLSNLQGEFDNIMKSILLRIPDVFLSDSTQKVNTQLGKEVEVLKENIRSASSRVSSNFREYDDVTKPVLAMLQGLDIGLSLAALAGAERSKIEENVMYVCGMTPFLGAVPQTMLTQSFRDLERMSLSGLDLRLSFLEDVALVQSVEHELPHRGRSTMLESFHSLYREWKEKLDQDQREKAAQSSLYKYQSVEDDNEAIEIGALLDIFHSYDDHLDKSVTPEKLFNNPKAVALGVSHLHRDIFCSSGTAVDKILRKMDKVSSQISTLWAHNGQNSRFPIGPEQLLPALIQGFSKARDSLAYSRDRRESYNFYVDANIVETETLVALVREIQARFLDLQQVWPEHAILDEVLKASKELLSFKISVPVAKMLTKAEQLHHFINEWQVVASREFTAVGLFDRLTNLLISWRRLELSTWSQLLDMEDKLCKDDSDSWWFIAYEVVVAVPMSLISEQGDVCVYAQQLYTTLEKFLGTTSKGQYMHRLNLLQCFEGHLALLAEEHKSLNVIRSSLNNFLRFHHHFDDPMQRTLTEGRKSLEKDLKEVLLFASWKDTNIVALRDSAKRSHHKLFKVVRRYRSLLAQPANDTIQLGISDVIEVPGIPLPFDFQNRVTRANTQALEYCQKHWRGWDGKAARLKNANATAQIMLQLSHYPKDMIDASDHLKSIVSALTESMTHLRKETPKKITSDNKAATKHLKTRKKNLFSHTIKTVREMGFRSNISSAIIAKQETTAAVLSNSPSVQHAMQGDVTQADHYLHCILNLMPRIRESVLQHSDDLTNGEVTKSIGYFESMLCTIVRQRTLLACTADEMAAFHATCAQMTNLWAPDKYDIEMKDTVARMEERNVRNQVQWLSSIVETAIAVLSTHQKLNESDEDEALACLTNWKKDLSELEKVFASLPTLPHGMSSTTHITALARYHALMKALRDQLKHMEAVHPNLAFIFKQIRVWITSDDIETDHEMHDPDIVSLTAFAKSISDFVNSLLVAVQHMRETLDSKPIESGIAGWLLEVDKALVNGLERLHARRVADMLGSILSLIPRLDGSTSHNVKLASAICAVILPIVQQYYDTLQTAFLRYAKLHLALCRIVHVLAKTFSQLVKEGFCSPSDESDTAQSKDEKLEAGMGLGDGEGAEDISKDIGNDEDLTDLAERANKEDTEPNQDIKDQDDAVNMDHDGLVGENGEVAENSEDENDPHESDDNEIDDEIGSVDDLDPGAVDEKIWDSESRDDDKKDKEDDTAKGQSKEEQISAAGKEQTKTDDKQSINEESAEELDVPQDVMDEVAKEGVEKVDPYTQQETNLDLPEGMDLDIDNELDSLQSDDDVSTELSDLDVEEELADNVDKMEEDEDNAQSSSQKRDESEAEHSDELEKAKDNYEDNPRADSPVDTEPEDEGETGERSQEMLTQNHTKETALDANDVTESSEVQGLGQDVDLTQANDDAKNGAAQSQKGVGSAFNESSDMQIGTGDDKFNEEIPEDQRRPAQKEENHQEPSGQPFQNLGDALREFHKNLRQIQEASDEPRESQSSFEAQIDEFEHLGDDEQDEGTQALGPTSSDLARPLDGLDIELEKGEPRTFPPDSDDKEGATNEDEAMENDKDLAMNSHDLEQRTRAGAIVGEQSRLEHESHQLSANSPRDFAESMDETENDISLDPVRLRLQEASQLSLEEASQLWSYYEATTQGLSLFLTEQLRLILTPTQATKMRGDFRTGKRLNIKRIIPYIASNFKQDKIWMRRSIPSKRNYQILLALDDSRSMSENGSGRLAFQTLAIITKSLSILEVGEICVVGFGDNISVAHHFDTPFTLEAGGNILRHFTFQQESTNVARLVDRSTTLLREARLKQTRSSQDLLQLELVISDGLCEDHEKVRRLVQQAMEERIMIVFVIVDALLQKNSILDLTQAVFVGDAAQGNAGVRIKRYLDTFPFTYYLVVGDVKDLPRVLTQALRQWFAEVSGI